MSAESALFTGDSSGRKATHGGVRRLFSLDVGASLGRGFSWTVADIIGAVLLITYCWFFWRSVSSWWFNPEWTTDDALQQSFPFYKALDPSLFQNDLITEVMEGYLAPAHYWLNWYLTKLTGNPIMAGHIGMLLQMLFALVPMFLLVRRLAGFAPACFATIWLLHTRHIIQRLTGGLPRGWAAGVLCTYLYLVVRRSDLGVRLLLLLGCLLHPPATFMVGVSYGFVLLWRSWRKETRSQGLRALGWLCACAPIYALVTFKQIERPAYIGQMATYQEAAQMPEFSWPRGRFPFVPLRPVKEEIKTYGFQAFVARFYNPGRLIKRNIWWFVTCVTVLIVGVGAWRKRQSFPAEFATYLASIFIVYFLSRLLAFKLYVPDRHLQFPLGIFFIAALTVGAWVAFHRAPRGEEQRTDLKSSWASILAILALAVLVGWSGGTGLDGSANFNYSVHKKGNVFVWIRAHTPKDALIAGHPSHIDGTQLFGVRRAYATTETAHPFYPVYYREIERRLKNTLRAHYAADLRELYSILSAEKIDYFVFKREDFYPDKLPKVTYYVPLDAFVAPLVHRPNRQFAYYELPQKVDLTRFPFMPFRDKQSVVVDVKKLGEFLTAQHNEPRTVTTG